MAGEKYRMMEKTGPVRSGSYSLPAAPLPVREGQEEIPCLLSISMAWAKPPASWEAVLRVLGQESGGLCPDLFGLIRGKEVCYENLYQAFSRYCGALPAPLTLCGLSLGGVLALQYGIEHSDRVGALVLIGTQFVMPKGLLRLQNAMFRLMPGSMFSASGLSKADTMRLSRSMMALDFRGCLARLRCPVLAVCGTGDHANQKAARQLCRLVPPGGAGPHPRRGGHEVNTDAPEALAEVLVRFLRPSPDPSISSARRFSMTRVLLLTTGGTIASRRGDQGLEPQISARACWNICRTCAPTTTSTPGTSSTWTAPTSRLRSGRPSPGR